MHEANVYRASTDPRRIAEAVKTGAMAAQEVDLDQDAAPDFIRQELNLDAVKSRLGSISTGKINLMSQAVRKLLKQDLPMLIAEVNASRRVVKEAKKHVDNLPWTVVEKLEHFNEVMKCSMKS